ncbi:MAG: BolA family protein [Polyangiaceae bacterium]
MIEPIELWSVIAPAFPGAEIEVVDQTGTLDHFEVRIVSAAFAGKSLLESHRLAMAAVRPAIEDGRVHAVTWKTYTPEQWAGRARRRI